MNKRYAFMYFMSEEVEKIGKNVPAHVAYWEDRQLNNESGGPFADRSGGLIVFEAKDMDDAERVVNNDPFVQEDVIAQKWLKQWLVA